MDQELERFKTEIDLRVYAAHRGYELDRKESWAGSAVMRHPNNDKVIITREAASRHYVYFSVRDETDKGTVIDFAMRRLGVTMGAARKELRAFMGMPDAVQASYPPLVRIPKDRISVERAYARMEDVTGFAYLENERAIPRAILTSRRFTGRIRLDARNNAVFPHFDAEGLCGFELKNHGFTGFAPGGTKGLWTSNIEADDRHLVVCESAIDALSHAVLFPDEHARYASIGGRPTPKQRELLSAAAAALPESGIVIAAMDADAAGRELAEILREAVSSARRPDIRFEHVEPENVKDWNDALRAKTALRIKKNRLDRARPS